MPGGMVPMGEYARQRLRARGVHGAGQTAAGVRGDCAKKAACTGEKEEKAA